MKIELDYIEEFLTKNGFEKESGNIFTNSKCKIVVTDGIKTDDYYEIVYKEGSIFSLDLKLYWLIGCLTYEGLMDKNYKQ